MSGPQIRQIDLEEIKRIGDEFERKRKEQIDRIAKKAEEDLELFMYSVGDFNPRHYMRIAVEDNDFDNNRFTLGFKYEYIGTDRQKKAAINILKKIHGKKDFDKVRSLHRNFWMLER